MHHGIGSTHVAHHVNPQIPHYNCWEAKEILRKEYPEIYLYDETPIYKVMWRVATLCHGVQKADEGYYIFKQN